MIGLLQRVTTAKVTVNNKTIAQIGQGLLVFIGVEKRDTEQTADRLLNKLFSYRVFNDEQGKLNLSLEDIHGEMLLVPQFTLPADTRKGLRPSFSASAPPEQGKKLFEYLILQAKDRPEKIASGEFGADMQVLLVNDGPVTFWLQVNPER